LDWTRPFSWGVIPFEFNQARKWFHQLWPLLTTAGVLLLWVTSLPNIDLRQMTDLGLVSVLPPRFFMAFSLLILSFSFLVNQQPARSWVLLLHIIVLVLMVHGTPPAVYETLRYSWAWKHVGIVDYIQRYGSVNPTDTYFDAYHNWPGFFALSALITEIAGFESGVSFANWAPVFFNLLSLGALLLIMKALTQDQRLVWLSVWFFFLANWVGQDYFSPQALSYFLYLVTLGICLGWFRITTPSTNHGIPILTRLKRVAPLYGKYLSPVASRDVANRQSQPLERVGLLLIAILLMGVITFTHQLTPFMTIGSLTALVVFRRLSPRGLPLLMTILTTTWISYMAAAFLNDTVETVAETIARLLSNADATLIDISIVSPGQALVALMGRGLTVFIGGLAFLEPIRISQRHGTR
jgi:hypothetical protein